MIEMTFDPLQFGEYVFAHRVGDIDMVTRDLQVHRFAPICLYGFLDVQRIPAGQASGFRSCEGGMPRPSRYLATVLLATCMRSEEHTSELQSLMRISYAVFCLKKKQIHQRTKETTRDKYN